VKNSKARARAGRRIVGHFVRMHDFHGRLG
jgi:hypothetical protein